MGSTLTKNFATAKVYETKQQVLEGIARGRVTRFEQVPAEILDEDIVMSLITTDYIQSFSGIPDHLITDQVVERMISVVGLYSITTIPVHLWDVNIAELIAVLEPRMCVSIREELRTPVVCARMYLGGIIGMDEVPPAHRTDTRFWSTVASRPKYSFTTEDFERSARYEKIIQDDADESVFFCSTSGLDLVPTEFRTREVYLEAVSADAREVLRLPDDLSTDAEIWATAVAGAVSVPGLLEKLPEHLRTEEFFLSAVEASDHPFVCLCIPKEFMTPSVTARLVERWPRCAPWVDELAASSAHLVKI